MVKTEGKPLKSALKDNASAPKSQTKPAKSAKQSSDSDSDDLDSDGGVSLESPEGEEEGLADGVHPDRKLAVINNSQSSKEAHAKQKQLVKERKAAKPMADDLARTKKIWERLRRKSHVPKEERQVLVAELFEIITGRIKDFVLKHDSVRVVQTALKYANPEQKKMIAKELAGTYRQLAESKYAKFLIGKLLVQGDNEIRDIIVPEFYGHVRRLIKHPEASWILDDIYRGVATKQQKAIILREWYGAEFALFQDDKEKVLESLSEILAADAGKRAPIMKSLQELINHLIQKKLTGFTLLHDAMLQYFLNVKQGTEEITDFIELIRGDEEGDLLKNLAFTRSGSRVVCLTLAYGNAKDRKVILRTYKDTLQMMAGDPNGHIIILTAFEVIDDTKSTAKAIFPELLSKDDEKQVENIVYFANDLNARTTLLYLYQGRSKALFPAGNSTDLEILAEIDTARQTTSKKDPEVRRSELAKALSPFLLKAIEIAASDLVSTSFGAQFITEVLFGAEGDKSGALKAVAVTASGDPSAAEPVPEENAESDIPQPPPHLANTAGGGRMLKSLVAGGRFDPLSKTITPISPPLNFADILYPNIKDNLVSWATSSSSFVPLALLEVEDFSSADEVRRVLKENKKVLQTAAKDETAEQSLKRETFEKEQVEAKANGKKVKVWKKSEVGNKGAALLLEKL
ncbi:armadillo-type protein [Amylocarpus encephaloides]|uniref:Armadillo-type protein n=1 Tax=Amylocarpus encephaloides TaxID=45428 RepID=A0A9P7YHT6_9HELO|nr:armadillo-type protein [Amylocarpus encephaloides]